MPSFTYHGDDRYYPGLGLEVTDGDTHELDAAPDDGRWADETGAPVEPPLVVLPPVEPVEADDESPEEVTDPASDQEHTE